jgi:hypothetical protein
MTDLVADLFTSGRVVDFILCVVVVEIAVLALFPRLRGAMSLTDVALLIAPGVMLLLALRAALTGAPHTITAAILAAAFVFHLWDVIRRRRGGA